MSSSPPVRIGRYLILGEIGRGSMGVVYLARDPNLDRRIALKVMTVPPGSSQEESREMSERFLLEARAAALLNHPGIVTIYDADVDPETGQSFFAMEWVEGRSLKQIIEISGRLPYGKILSLGQQLAVAIGSAHQVGLVHRDLKPANILITPEWRAKILDFGIAKLASQQLTLTGHVLGSPYYMSPEQVRGDVLDGRSDLFSLGTVLYRMTTGLPPFEGESLATVTYKVVNIESRPLSEHRPTVPTELERVIETCLAKDPNDRPQSGEELAHEMSQIIETLGEIVEDEETAEPAVLWSAPTELRPSLSDEPDSKSFQANSEGPGPGWGWKLTTSRLAVASVTATAILILLLIGFGGGSLDGSHSDLAPSLPSSQPKTLDDPTPQAQPLKSSIEHSPEIPPKVTGLTVIFQNRLKVAELSITVDGEPQWNGLVYGWKNLFKRARGREIQQQVWVQPGHHRIRVHIRGKSMKAEAESTIEGIFYHDQPRFLRADFHPYRDQLELSWMD